MTTIVPTGQGPYDGNDDTLVGLVNNSKLPIRTLSLTSTHPIFAFDGDGIDTYGAPGNAADATRYGGPRASFVASAPFTSGVVNFAPPIQGGTTTYFSLEGALSSAIACQDAINNSISRAFHYAGPETLEATFTPQVPALSLSGAAQLCGFADFDWQQYVTSIPQQPPKAFFNPFFAAGHRALVPPYLDPPQGGYEFGTAASAGRFPFYWGPANRPQAEINNSYLIWQDEPNDVCIDTGPQSAEVAALRNQICAGHIAPMGSVEEFSTMLAGVNADGSPTNLGVGLTWGTTFNGTAGSASQQAGAIGPIVPTDPGSGTGSATVTGMQETTDYQYDGFTITAVNDVPVVIRSLSSTSMSVSAPQAEFGSPVTFTATVATVSPTSPSGTVQFFLDGQSAPIADIAVTAGQASFTTSGLGTGTHSVTASYSGDADAFASTALPVSVVVSTHQVETSSLKGAVIVPQGSTVLLRNVTLAGSVVVEQGGAVDIEGSTITGAVTADSPLALRLCGSAVSGAVSTSAAAGFVLIGDPGDDACPSNSIGGALDLQHDRHGLDAIDNQVGGAIVVSGNSGVGAFPIDVAPEIYGNVHR